MSVSAIHSERTPRRLRLLVKHMSEAKDVQRSRLYVQLLRTIAAEEDDDVFMSLMMKATARQPTDILLLGCLHYLVLNADERGELTESGSPLLHRLGRFYASTAAGKAYAKEVEGIRVNGEYTDQEKSEIAEALTAIVTNREYRAIIEELISNRSVQTNEVRRSASILPALIEMLLHYQCSASKVVELGCSAGLCSAILYYRFRFVFQCGAVLEVGPWRSVGDTAPILETNIDGALADESVPKWMQVCWAESNGTSCSSADVQHYGSAAVDRAMQGILPVHGIDLHLVPLDSEGAKWLRALIWPEDYYKRAPTLQAATKLCSNELPHVHLEEGDALSVIEQQYVEQSTVPDGAPFVLFHTFALYQFPEQLKETLNELLLTISRTRRVLRICFDIPGVMPQLPAGYNDDALHLPFVHSLVYESGREELCVVRAEAAAHSDHTKFLDTLPPRKLVTT